MLRNMSPRCSRDIYVVRTEPRPSKVFDTYWKFAAERQAIFVRRLQDLPRPWTSDPVLQTYKFTNAYRASDRTSQYLIRRIIYSKGGAIEDVLFRTLLFKLFNKAETWELLTRAHGEPSLRTFKAREYDRTLTLAMQQGASIYSAAYIMPSGSAEVRKRRKHTMHLQLLERMRKDHFFDRVASLKTMKAGYELLRSYPSDMSYSAATLVLARF
jgi:hypothetical protein